MASAPAWSELQRLVPDELARYMPKLAWSHERLWALDLPVEPMAVAELAWQLDLPWWRDRDRFFAVRPSEVLAAPNRHSEQYERTLAADLSYPIDITLRLSRWFILDGVHRLLKAVALGRETIEVRKLGADEFALIAADGPAAPRGVDRQLARE